MLKLNFHFTEEEIKCFKEEVLNNNEFLSWATGYFSGKRIATFVLVKDALADFRKNTSHKYWNIKYFEDYIRVWGLTKGFDLNPIESIGRFGFCHDDLQRRTERCFYLRKKETLTQEEILKNNREVMLGEKFESWANGYFDENRLNMFIPKTEAFQDFENSTKEHWTSQRFKQALRAWSEYKGYILNPPETLDKHERCTIVIKEKSVEMIFLKAK